jgi:transposase-like protein
MFEGEGRDGRRVLNKWSEAEKQQAIQLLEQLGKNWNEIARQMGNSKKPDQIKNFYQNYKKKLRLDEKLPGTGERRRGSRRRSALSPGEGATLGREAGAEPQLQLGLGLGHSLARREEGLGVSPFGQTTGGALGSRGVGYMGSMARSHLLPPAHPSRDEERERRPPPSAHLQSLAAIALANLAMQSSASSPAPRAPPDGFPMQPLGPGLPLPLHLPPTSASTPRLYGGPSASGPSVPYSADLPYATFSFSTASSSSSMRTAAYPPRQHQQPMPPFMPNRQSDALGHLRMGSSSESPARQA